MAKNTKSREDRGVGSSAFTHVDDMGADLHPSDPDHHEAMFYGGGVPGKSEVNEVVLGPPAFGSPDPRTLGHVMMPATDHPVSAPELSSDYAGDKQAQLGPTGDQNQGGASTSSDKSWNKSMSKADLLKEADSRNLDVDDTNTKEEILSALENEDTSSSSSETNWNKSDSKADLLKEADSRGLDVDDTNTKEEIVAALEDDDNSNS